LPVPAGTGKRFTVSVDRIDGFEGEVQVELSGLPEGWRASSPLTIQAGHRTAAGVLVASVDAKQPTDEESAKISVQAKAQLDGSEVAKPVNNFGKLKLEPKPKLLVTMEPAEITVAPGASVTATLRVERNGFEGLVSFEVEDLPHGVIVDNIGLSGVLLPKEQSERQIFITADAWVPETTRSCFAIANQGGNPCSGPVTLHVKRAAPLAVAK